MEKSIKLSETDVESALYAICCSDVNDRQKQEKLNILKRLGRSGNKKIIKLLLTLIVNDDEETSVRDYASSFLFKYIERVNPLVRPMMHIILNALQIPAMRHSMKKVIFLFVDIVADAMQKQSNRDYCHFVVCLVIKCIDTKNDTELHELAAILLHALLKNSTKKILPHAMAISEGLQKLLKMGKSAHQKHSKKSYFQFYHTLMCVKILGQHMSKLSLILQTFRNSLQNMLDLLKYVAAYGSERHFNEVAELLKILLKYKKFSGKKWSIIFTTTQSLCRNKRFQDHARMRTIEILGNVIIIRMLYFQKPKILQGLLWTLINILCQNPKNKHTESLENKKLEKVAPTPISAAADLLEFIAIEFPPEIVTDITFRILLSIIKESHLNEWRFRGIYLSLARISKTCGDYINEKYGKDLVLIFKAGFTDNSKNVWQAAVYALYELLTCRYMKCFHFIKQTFRSFLTNMRFLVCDQNMESTQNALHVERLFVAMTIICSLMDIDMIPHLPLMMNNFQNILKHTRNHRIIICIIELFQRTLYFVGASFLPYISDVILQLKSYIINWENKTGEDDIRSHIIQLLTHVVICTSPNVKEIDVPEVVLLVFNILQMQHEYTLLRGGDLEILLKYSPLRRSIFRFILEVSYRFEAEISKYMPKIIGTILGTIISVRYICPQELEYMAIGQERPWLIESTVLGFSKTTKYFKINDNNETETMKFSVQARSFSLKDEILQAMDTLQIIMETCKTATRPYFQTIFQKLCYALKNPSAEMRKQILYILNNMMISLMDNFYFENGTSFNLCMAEIVELLAVEEDFTIISECVHSILYFAAIKEKHLQVNLNTHTFLCNLMKEIFNKIVSVPENGENIRKKDILLNQIIAFMHNLKTICEPKRFENYFSNFFLNVFEAKINMPLNRSSLSDHNRYVAFEKLVEGFHVTEKDNIKNFNWICSLFLKGLNDPTSKIREISAASLGMLVKHYDLQPLSSYKLIIDTLWKKSKRESPNEVLLDCIFYGIAMTVKRNVWQLPIQKLSTKLIHLLPVRHILDYNTTVVEVFEKLYIERPSDIAPIVKDIYKFLLEILEDDFETDMDPLYKSALTFAANLYGRHIEELRQFPITPTTMQAILNACKNQTCLKALLR